MVFWSEEVAEEEGSVTKEGDGGSGDTTATEGLVRLRKRFQEPIQSRKEPIHDLLQKVSDSYNPRKKKKTPTTRGITTRSQKKKNEANLKKALAESAKKVVAKEKKKVGENETIQIEGMDLALHDEDEVKEVKVVTPSAKKRKTSKKKSLEKSIEKEGSALSKITRSARKLRKVQIVEEESEKEKTSEEKDKVVKFQKRTILKGRLLSDLEEEGMVLLLEKLEIQDWTDVVLQLEGRLARAEIMEFFANCEITNGRVNSEVKGVKVSFDDEELGEILVQTVAKEHVSSKRVPKNIGVRKLEQESGAKDVEIERLKTRLAEVEAKRDSLKTELVKEKEKKECILQDMLKLLLAKNQEPGSILLKSTEFVIIKKGEIDDLSGFGFDD
ncbi:uncharacterized protein [Nicotiana tomentosiformis]|uniref:uncharacterized protein n=1 Tax=Nicotiana tomentosiformis TaxID=4098 RepID=UPI00388CE9AD